MTGWENGVAFSLALFFLCAELKLVHSNTDNVAGAPFVTLPSGNTVVGTFFHGVPAYRGIRYAKAERFDVPHLWRAPVGETIFATDDGPSCTQLGTDFNVIGQEDCLFLNVFTPNSSSAGKRAVMVWIHGGCFQTGSGNSSSYDYTDLVQEGDIVLVTINYRLNVFGFFTPMEANATKNFGLRDQIVALQWVQSNIGVFGGDSDRVTVFGQSAGGLSVLLLYRSPLAVGLFHRGIAHSPGFITPGQFQHPWSDAAKTMGRRCMRAAQCDSIACLRSKTTLELANACFEYLPCGAAYVPVFGSYFSGYDGDVVNESFFAPTCKLESYAYARRPLILGNVKNEWRLLQLVGNIPEYYSAFLFICVSLCLCSFIASVKLLKQCCCQSCLGKISGWKFPCVCLGVSACLCALKYLDLRQYDPPLLAQDVETVFLSEHLSGYVGAQTNVQQCARKRLHQLYSAARAGNCALCSQAGDPGVLEMASAMEFVIGAQLGSAQLGGPRYRYILDAGDDITPFGTGHGVDVLVMMQESGRMLRQYLASFAKTGVPTSTLGPTWEPVERSSGLLGLPLLDMQVQGSACKGTMSSTAWFSNRSAALLADMACGHVSLRTEPGGGCSLETLSHASTLLKVSTNGKKQLLAEARDVTQATDFPTRWLLALAIMAISLCNVCRRLKSWNSACSAVHQQQRPDGINDMQSPLI